MKGGSSENQTADSQVRRVSFFSSTQCSPSMCFVKTGVVAFPAKCKIAEYEPQLEKHGTILGLANTTKCRSESSNKKV